MTKQMSGDDWVTFLWALHNEVRNANGIKLTGMAALNEINNFLLIRFADKKIKKLIEKDELPKICKFSYLYKNYASDEKIEEDKHKKGNENTNAYLLHDVMYNIMRKKGCVMKCLVEHEFFQKYLFNDVIRSTAYVKKPTVCETVQRIINMISKKLENEELGYDFFDKFGSAYEIFKTDACKDKTTGQHFTPVAVKKFIMDEIKPQYNETIYEPCAGSGGFIHTAYSYVHQHDEENQKEFKKNIYANECNPEIIKPLMINMLLHDIPVENIHEQDSLSNENCKEYNKKFDIITTNPPFGMSTVINPNIYLEKYWDPIKSGKSVIKDSSGQFIMHIYNSLKDGGRCGFVIDRGILNNGNSKASWQCKLREFLIENTNITKIVLLPTGIFTYTNFATAIIFFTKGEKTTEVKVYEGQFTDVKKKEGLMIDEKSVKILKYDDIKKSGYSLKIENETKNDVKKIGYVKLGDIVKIQIGGTPSTKKQEYWNGENKWVSIKELNENIIYDTEKKITVEGIENSSVKKIEKGSIMVSFKLSIGKTGIAGNDMYCNEAIMFFKHNNEVTTKYLWRYIQLNNICIAMDGTNKTNGSIGTGSLNSKTISEIPVKLTDISHQQEIVEFLDKIFEQYDINKLPEIIKDTPIFELLILRRYNDFADAMQLIYRKIEADAMQKKFDDDKKAMFRWMLNDMQCETKKLGNIVKINTGTHVTPEMKIEGQYPVYGGGNISFYINQFNRENEIIISRMGVSINCVRYEKGKFFLTEHGWTLDCTDKIIKMYLYYYLWTNQDELYAISSGSAQKGINHENFYKLQVKVPNIIDQRKLVSKMDELELPKLTYQTYADELQIQIDNMMKTIKQIKEDAESDKLQLHFDEQKKYVESMFELWKKNKWLI